MKKKIFVAIMVGLLALSLMGTAMAMDTALSLENNTSVADLRAVETTWHYRIINGQAQMRLWSNTEGKWLTDWIDM